MRGIELDTEITADHAIHLKLPNEVRHDDRLRR